MARPTKRKRGAGAPGTAPTRGRPRRIPEPKEGNATNDSAPASVAPENASAPNIDAKNAEAIVHEKETNKTKPQDTSDATKTIDSRVATRENISNVDKRNSGDDHAEDGPAKKKALATATSHSTALDNEKAAKIRNLLEHRKFLLKSLQMGRRAAQKRIDDMIAKDPGKSSQTDDQEVATFVALMRNINSLARKQQGSTSEQQQPERRSSVSLRRGSSVGKYMSLLPGEERAFSSALTPKASLMGVTAKPEQKMVRDAPVSAHPKLPASSSSLQQQQQQQQQQQHRKLPQRIQSALSQQQSSALEKSGGLNVQGRMAPVQPPPAPKSRVVCPETMVLRERRDAIRKRLTNMGMQRQIISFPSNKDDLRRSSLESVSSVGFPSRVLPSRPPLSPAIHQSSHEKKKNHRRPYRPWEGPSPAPTLPRRRKTHWDTVLAEMRWLSTDFREERKWKHSQARIVCHAIATAHTSPKSLPTRNETEVKNASSEVVDRHNSEIRARKPLDSSLFVEFSTEIEESAREKAKIISKMITESVAVNEESSFFVERSTEMHQEDLTTSAIRNESPANRRNVTPTDSLSGRVSISLDRQLDGLGLNSDRQEFLQLDKEEFLERTSRHIDDVLKLVGGKSTNSKISKALAKTHGMGLSDSEKRAVDAIEDYWNRMDSGAVLRGPVASGKTIATCSLIWRHSASGLQLLICSEASVLRWMHELARFPSLSIHSSEWLTEKSELRSMVDERFNANDVVVCQYSAINEISESILTKFRTVVIDCRHPTGFDASRSPTIVEFHPSSWTQTHEAAPLELKCSSWWTRVAGVFAKSEMRRLLVEKPGVGDALHFLNGLPKKKFIEILALRTGLLVGSKIFSNPIFPLDKSILLWARHRVKSSPGSGTKFERVKEILTNVAKHFYCFVETGKNLEVDVLSTSNSKTWEIRRCRMTPLQEMAYLKGCKEVRSHLSRCEVEKEATVDNHHPFASAILRLRRLCVHADIDRILLASMSECCTPKACDFPSSYADCKYKMISGLNSSQPNFELALSILEGSSKLHQLLLILVNDCGYSSLSEDILKIVPAYGHFDALSHETTAETKKVVILANLPEVQILVSLLLDSIGVKNEILLRSMRRNDMSDLSELDSKIDTLAWTHSQLILSRFNGGKSHWKNDVNIVVGSPLSIAGDHCGLGAEQADIIISLDEDWSGRCELLLQALILRSRLCKESIGKTGCRLVKLLAKNTCEDFFLDSDTICSNAECSVKSWPWPLDVFGVFSVPGNVIKEKLGGKIDEAWPHRPPGKDRFAFPGSNLFCGRGRDIEEVLFATTKLPSPLFLQKRLKFIDDGNEAVLNRKLLESLVQTENAASKLSFRETTFGMVRTLTPIVPPLQFPVSKDLPVLFKLSFSPGRMYFEHIGTDATLHDVGGESKRERLVLPSALDTSGIQVHPVLEDVEIELATKAKEPVEAASSLLFHGQKLESNHLRSRHHTADPDLPRQMRYNFFAASFTTSTNVPEIHDGNQGSEALVFFPPLFPRLQECAILAKNDIESLRSRDSAGHQQKADNGSLKRDSCFLDSSFESKRPRLDKITDNATSKCSNEPPVITEDEATHSDAASVLMDLADDFGLAGMGAVPLPRDSALASGWCSIDALNISSITNSVNNEWIRSTPYCDPEELQAASLNGPVNSSTNSMILLVSKKRQRGYSNPSSFSAFSRLPTTDNSRSGQPQGIQFQNPQDAHRYRLLTMLRQSGTGTTMFESPAFRVASVRLRAKVSDRVAHHTWSTGPSFESGPGLPLLVSRQQGSSNSGNRGSFEVDRNLWTSLVKRLKNKEACTGGEAIELSFAQRTALRRSLVAPCRVDFGPFHCGFLSPPSGMTVATPHRPRAGVSLPMGVKIAHSTKEIALSLWSEEEESDLQAAAVKFGMNWMLAARSLGGFQDISICSQQESLRYKSSRAARSCRDHWQAMARKNPSLIVKVRQSESFFSRHFRIPDAGDEGERLPLLQKQDESNSAPSNQTVFLLPSDNDLKDDEKRNETQVALRSSEANAMTSSVNRRRSFRVFKAARAKRQEHIVNIPGIPSGSTPTMVASHPSHDDAVNSSISMSWIGMRTDMWPLQLLDAAEKQRQANVATAVSSAPLISSQPEQIVPASLNQITDGGQPQPPPQPRPKLPSSAMPPAPKTHIISKMANSPANLSNGSALSSRSPLIRTNNGASGTAKQSFVPPPASSPATSNNKPPSPTQTISTPVSNTKPQPSLDPDNQGHSEKLDEKDISNASK